MVFPSHIQIWMKTQRTDGGERLLAPGETIKGRLVMGKIKVVKKQLKAELRGFQFAGLNQTEGLDTTIQSSAEKQTKFWMK